jgi:hypothetical protein
VQPSTRRSSKLAAHAEPAGGRLENLRNELIQLDDDLRQLRAEARELRIRGREQLRQADVAWDALGNEGRNPTLARSRPEPPHIFSVELINAGPGESILIHYGTPDSVRLVMINGGPRGSYRQFVEPRLLELRESRFDSRPVPIERFIAGDQDSDKVEGLLLMLEHIAETQNTGQHLVDLKGILANFFRVENGSGLRYRLRLLIDQLGVPLNQPFDHLVMRPDRGRAVVAVDGGLEIVVLGPVRDRVRQLYDWSRSQAERVGGSIEGWPEENFSKVGLVQEPLPLAPPQRRVSADSACVPSENARRHAGGRYIDRSLSNLASTILLFRYRGLTFLHTGDARGDLILDGLESAGLLDDANRAYVDMMSIPHGGSDQNVTPDFFERVKADGYLFSGEGRHGNPEIATVAALIAARGCEQYRMYFVNRDGPDDIHGARLDAFFHEELPYNVNYRRIFRSSERGSVIIDLLDPVRY